MKELDPKELAELIKAMLLVRHGELLTIPVINERANNIAHGVMLALYEEPDSTTVTDELSCHS